MRVALLTNFIPPYRVSLFTALRRQVGELRVFISTRMEGSRSWEPEWGDLDVVVQRALTFRRKWRTSQFEEPSELHVPYDTMAQLHRYRPDVVITGELGMRSLQALIYGKALAIPVVLWATLSDRIERERKGARVVLRKVIIPRFAAVITNGAEGARYIKRFRADDPIRVPYTTDMSGFYSIPLTGRERKLLFVGALTRRKGFHLLLDACRAKGYAVVVIGDGPLREELPGVEYTGPVDYRELPAWYQRGGFLIMPSLADEWGVVVNEALAAGVPVVGSVYSQAVDELIQDGKNGFRFEPRDVEAVIVAVERASRTSDQDLLRMREHARATAALLEPESAAARIADLVKTL
jgi:glycosyltransferase involved in cell wall biosynthesis